MNKEFIPYQEALELKQLGFDEPCLAYYLAGGIRFKEYKDSQNKNSAFYNNTVCSIPLYQQAFRWFREKHNYHVIIDFNQSKNNKWYYGIIQIDHNISVSPDVEFETYEEAELAALKELIKTIKDRT
jgi:hypothetical protein